MATNRLVKHKQDLCLFIVYDLSKIVTCILLINFMNDFIIKEIIRYKSLF